MAASLNDVESWKARAQEMGATHVISVCDTFDWDDYPVFVMPKDSLEEKKAEYSSKDMQKINEVIEIA